MLLGVDPVKPSVECSGLFDRRGAVGIHWP